jgi:hypothetical protein
VVQCPGGRLLEVLSDRNFNIHSFFSIMIFVEQINDTHSMEILRMNIMVPGSVSGSMLILVHNLLLSM